MLVRTLAVAACLFGTVEAGGLKLPEREIRSGTEIPSGFFAVESTSSLASEVEISVGIGSTDTIWGAVVTLDYDSTVARFAGVALGSGTAADWEIVRVNDDRHVDCRPGGVLKRITVLAEDRSWVHGIPGTFEALRFRFSAQSCGTTPLELPLGCDTPSFFWVANNASTVSGWPLASVPPYENLDLRAGSLGFGCGTVAADRSAWSSIKALYR